MTRAAAGGAAPYYRSPSGDVVLYQGDAAAVLRALPAGSVHTCITSPPYFALRDYGTATWEGGDPECDHLGAPKRTQAGFNERYFGKEFAEDKQGELRQPYRAVCGRCGARRVDAQLGLEDSPDAYVAGLVAVFREVKRALRDDGTLWLNIGDGYNAYNGNRGESIGTLEGTRNHASPKLPGGIGLGAKGLKPKDLLMMPSRVALALQADGWWLRSMIPWLKRNAMPESATDRPTIATEYIFLLAKSPRYFYDAAAVALPASPDAAAKHPHGRRKMSAWKEAEDGSGIKSNTSFRDATSGVVSSRNRRNADWWFDSLRAVLDGATGLLADEDGAPLALPVNPESFPGAHFATFPRRLVEPMLLASTSAAGACGRCGAPYVRVTERARTFESGSGRSGTMPNGKHGPGLQGGGETLDIRRGPVVHVTTTGWRAGCACAEAGDPIPCTVLDPFAGASTTGIVARKHGRSFIGIELSEAYCRMSRERLSQMALPIGGLG